MLSIRASNPSCGSASASASLKRASSSLSSSSSSSAASMAMSMSMSMSTSLRFQSLVTPRCYRTSMLEARGAIQIPKGLGVSFRSLGRRISLNHSIVAFTASHEESKHSEIEVEKEKEGIDLEAEESQEAWEQTLASFKEQALKMQSVSQEAYEIYSKKAMVILKETSEQLKIQAEKARSDLSVIAKELSEEGKEYLSTAAENSPESVKEIVETFSSSTDDFNDISKVRDFHLGIPYGLLLSLGGLLSFMLTGSISAIRFGVILGGTLLALSISSLKSYKRGEYFAFPLKGQAAIATVIFLREMRLLSQRFTFPAFLSTSISGAMVAFYFYKIVVNGKQRRGSDFEPGSENDAPIKG